MAALSRLAGAMAHDYHALLSQILGSSEVAQQLLPFGHPASDCITRIQRAGSKAATLTARLLAFDPHHPCSGPQLEVDAHLRELHDRWHRRWGDTLPVTLTTAAGLESLRSEATLFDCALTDLVQLAEDAPIAGTATLIHTAISGDSVVITITLPLRLSADTILEAVLTGLADSDSGRRGRALGLAAADHLIRRWCGTLEMAHSTDQRTTLTVHLPRHCGDTTVIQRLGTTTARRRAGTTILVAEDDPGVRSLIVSFLRLQGFTVLEAEDGEIALTISAHHDYAIDVLLSDVVLPKRPGPVLADILRRKRPGLPVVLMSGFTDDAGLISGLGSSGCEFLQKPFAPHVLVQTIERLLDLAPLHKT